MPSQRQFLVSAALPYANGALHLGHLLGYIQADIWVRAQRLNGAVAHFVCADDAHGTPIMLAAEKAGVTAEERAAERAAARKKVPGVDALLRASYDGEAARATVGEIAHRLRDVWGEYAG